MLLPVVVATLIPGSVVPTWTQITKVPSSHDLDNLRRVVRILDEHDMEGRLLGQGREFLEYPTDISGLYGAAHFTEGAP